MGRMRQWVILAAVVVLAAGCGFKLQSRAELPADMQRVKLEIQDPYSEFARRVETLLEQNGAQVVSSGDDAYILEVPLNRMRKEIQSIGDNARVREYLVRHTVHFRLLDNRGREKIPLQKFEQTRVYSFNNNDILAAERENEFLRNDLADTLARMVIRRLGTYGT